MARMALKYGLACHLAGGTHHAFPSRGSGFCIFNDLAVTARWLIDAGKVNKVMIIDCDVHQGDGTAAKQKAEHNHPMVGAQLLSKHVGWEVATDVVMAYKERFDGTGYPEGLVGGMIPQGAFILSMAVRFIDVVWGKSGDEYKKSAMRVIQKVNSESGKGIPPHMVDAFNRAVRKLLVAKRR